MDFTSRKPNRIADYDYSQDGAYFVTICTQNRRPVLSRITSEGIPCLKPSGVLAQEMLCKLPGKYPGVYVDRYVIMPDHIHLLLRFQGKKCVAVSELGKVIGWFKYQVTKQVNALSGAPGERFFQRSYYDHVIRNQQDYNETWEYIRHNPLKWMIQKRGME